MTVLSAVVSLF